MMEQKSSPFLYPQQNDDIISEKVSSDSIPLNDKSNSRRMLLASLLVLFTPTLALNCKEENLDACISTEDCLEAFGDKAELAASCGTLYCKGETGTCFYNPWKSDCSDFYQKCFSDDAMCTAGPSGGKCNGWENQECIYEWCLGERIDSAGGGNDDGPSGGIGERVWWTPEERDEPLAFSTWAQTARIGGAPLYVGMSDEELNKILDELLLQGVSVVEGDSELSNYLTDAQIDQEILLMRRVADATHKRGMHLVWYYPALEVLTVNGRNIEKTMFKDHPEWLQVGVDGVPNVFYGGEGQVFWVKPDDESAWMSPSSPGYRDYFINRVRRIVRYGGLDGLWLDVPLFADFGPTEWSDANPAAVALFQNFTGYTFPTRKRWSDPAWRRFITFRHEEIARFLDDVTKAALEINPQYSIYAETLPTDYIGGTIYGLDGGYLKNIGGLTHVWEVDTMSNNVGMRKARGDDWISFISALKYTSAASGKKPSWVFSYGIEEDDAEQVMAQALIAGNNPYELKVPEMTSTVGTDFRIRMFGWMKSNLSYLYKSQSKAKVGILFSSHSRDFVDRAKGLGMFVTWDGKDDKLWWAGDKLQSSHGLDYLGEFRGMVKLLVNEHIPFNTLVFPDATELSAYDTIILPNTKAMSDEEASMLRDFVFNGGHLVITGFDPSGLNEYGTPRKEYALADLIGFSKADGTPPTKKQNSFGKGSVQYFVKKFGKRYFSRNDKAARRNLLTAIKAVTPNEATTDADPRVHMELSSLNDEIVFQFTNFIGINGSVAIIPHSFTVQLKIPAESTVSSVKLTSPDLTENVMLDFVVKSKTKISFSLTMKQYAMVVVSFVGGSPKPIENEIPVAGDDFLQTRPDTPLLFDNTMLLMNDGDMDGDEINLSEIKPAESMVGVFVDKGDGSYTYTPPSGFVGTDILTYKISDGRDGVGLGRVVIEVGIPTYFPQQVVVIEGQFGFGNMTSFESLDGNTYGIESVTSDETGKSVVDWYASTIIEQSPSDIASIEVRYAGHYSLEEGIYQEFFLYNFQNEEWDLKHSASVGTINVPILFLLDGAVVGSYISPSGELRARIRGVRSGSESYWSWSTLLNWDIMQSMSSGVEK